MHDKNKDKKFYTTWQISLKWILFLTVSPRAVFRTQSKVYGGPFLQKQLATTYFYMILYDFINCPASVDIKQTLPYKLAIE